MELLLVHDSGQAKIRNQQIRIVLWCPEQQVLRFQITMHNAMIMQISHRGQDRTNEVGRIGLVVAAFTTDAVKELSTQSKFGDEVYCNTQKIPSV
jgi:hypothetical protein